MLPWSYLTLGTLALPWSFRYDPELVAEALRQTLRQLPALRRPARRRPHGPRAARPEPPHQAGLRRGRGRGRRGLRGDRALLSRAERGARDGLGTDWPVAVDHGVDDGDVVGRGPGARPRRHRPAARRPGRHRSSASTVRTRGSPPTPRRGADQIAAAADLLAERAAAVLRGEPHDPLRGPAHLRGALLAGAPRAGGAGRVDRRCRRRAGHPRDEPGAGVALRVRARGAAGRAAVAERWPSSLVNPTPGETGIADRRRRSSGRSAGSTCAATRRPRSACPDRVAAGPHERRARARRWPGSPRRAFVETVDFR